MNLTDKQLEEITEKANDKKVIKQCEPQVCFPLPVEKWMVRRVLVAYEKTHIRQRP
jgi:hypothetical protein